MDKSHMSLDLFNEIIPKYYVFQVTKFYNNNNTNIICYRLNQANSIHYTYTFTFYSIVSLYCHILQRLNQIKPNYYICILIKYTTNNTYKTLNRLYQTIPNYINKVSFRIDNIEILLYRLVPKYYILYTSSIYYNIAFIATTLSSLTYTQCLVVSLITILLFKNG